MAMIHRKIEGRVEQNDATHLWHYMIVEEMNDGTMRILVLGRRGYEDFDDAKKELEVVRKEIMKTLTEKGYTVGQDHVGPTPSSN